MHALWTFTLTCMLAAGLSTSCYAAANERDLKEDKEQAPKTDGTWQLIEAELGGQKLPEQITKSITLTLKGDQYTVVTGEGRDEGTVSASKDKKPEEIDVIGKKGPNKGKTFPAIRELDGDTLKICYDLSGKERPKEFKTKAGTQQFLAIYRKQKP